MNFVNWFIRYFRLKVFKGRRTGFYVDLAKAIIDGDSLSRWLRSSEEHLIKHNQPGQAELYAEMLDNLNVSNGSLSGMMYGLVPDSDLLILSSIDAGRSDEEKHDGLQSLAESIETLDGLKNMIISSVAILAFVVPVTIGTLIAISLEFIPLYEKNLSHEYWSSLGKSLYYIAFATTNYYYIIVPVLSLLVWLYARSFAKWTGKTRAAFERYAKIIRIPHMLYKNYMCAVYFVSLAALLKTRTSLREALEILQEASSPYLKKHIETTLNKLAIKPKDITEAFDTGLVPPDLYLRLSNYSNKNGFDLGLIELATNGMKHVKGEVQTTSKYLNFLTIVFVALTVAYLYYGNANIAYGIKDYRESHMDSSF